MKTLTLTGPGGTATTGPKLVAVATWLAASARASKRAARLRALHPAFAGLVAGLPAREALGGAPSLTLAGVVG